MVSDTKSLSTRKIFPHFNIEHLLAGVSAGVTSTLVLHPLDLLKIRFAVNDGQLLTRPSYPSLGNAVSTIVRTEGFRGLYRGVIPNCVGSGASWGLYFLFYNAIRSSLMETDNKSKVTLGPGSNMLAGAGAGLIIVLALNPIWVVKTRMCLQYQPCSPTSILPSSKQYTGMLDAFAKVYRHEGMSGMYKGLVPGIIGVSHGAFQMMAYEELKKKYISHYHLTSDDKLGPLQHISFSAISKIFAATVTYPYQVVRARLQDQYSDYSGVSEVVKRTWRHEGFKGFYKGIVPNLLRVTPATAITFTVYETIVKYLKKEN